ncbi:MAG: hypothetical protein IKF51_05625 [Solobacterium sp.]|nr:hypothetical protein [Solobacterium sp.]
MNNLIYERMFFYAAIVISVLGLLLYLFGTGFRTWKQKLVYGTVMVLCAVCAWFLPLPGLVLSVVITLIMFLNYRRSLSRLSFRKEDWQSAADFEASYRDEKEDSGNYVILTAPAGTEDPSAYETAYVGGSPTVYKEVHHVLNDRMLSKVHDDLQAGKVCWIRIIPAPRESLDADRQKLIELYHGIPYLLSFDEVRKKREKVH